jgi:hypothetical protein
MTETTCPRCGYPEPCDLIPESGARPLTDRPPPSYVNLPTLGFPDFRWPWWKWMETK